MNYSNKLVMTFAAALFSVGSLTAQELIHYTGTELSDPNAHDGRLSPVVGVHNIQTMRANREKPSASNGNGWTYNHQPMMAYWNGRFYMHYLSDPVDEHVPPSVTFLQTSADGYTWTDPVELFPAYEVPEGFRKPDLPYVAEKGTKAIMHQRVGFYVSKSGKLIAMGNYGICLHKKEDDPNDGNGIGVPLYTEPVDPDQCNKVQSSEAEVWAQVIQDLTDAINEPALPDNQIGGEGRVSKGTAYALRGRAYLITKQYDKAVADFEQVDDCGYSLFQGGYKELFKQENERCEEMVMSLQYIEDPTGYGSRLQKYCAAFTQGSQDSRGCWTDLQVTPALVNLYEEINPDGTVKDFAWEDYLGDAWTYVTNKEASEGHTRYRKVFFLRDKYVNGMEVHSTVTTAIDAILADLPADIQAYYLPEGNEARLKAAYANRDPRLEYNVVTPYADYLGVNSNSTAEGWYTYRWPVSGKYYFDQTSAEPNANPNLPDDYYTSGCCNAQAEFKYIHRKYVGEGLEYLRRQDNPIDEPIIRYADVLLMEAEAEVEQNHLTEAMALVKQVRDRVGIPTPAEKFADQETARNYVRDERRREFVNEGINFFDEMRWRTLKETKFSQVCAQHAWGGSESTGGTTYNWIGDQWYTWPVPKSEIELNPAMTPTPGWEY